MCRLAREGKIKNFTGVDNPYEPPFSPEVSTTTVGRPAGGNAEAILSRAIKMGLIRLGAPSR